MNATFEVGNAYESPYCSNIAINVVARTEKTVTFDGHGKKRIFTDNDGNEYAKLSPDWWVWSTKDFVDPEIRRELVRIKNEERKEAERQARLKVEIPTFKRREVPTIDKSILMAWTLANDIENLVRFARSIEAGGCMICQDTRFSHCEKIIYFEGFTVTVHQGNDDVFTQRFHDNNIHGSRHGYKDVFKVEASHTYEYGFSLTEEGVWLKDGEEFRYGLM